VSLHFALSSLPLNRTPFTLNQTTKIDIKTEGSEGNVGIEEEEIELSHPVLLRAVQILRPGEGDVEGKAANDYHSKK